MSNLTYQTIKKIGEGGFGTTYLATMDDHKVVVKTLKKDTLDINRFKTEVAALEKLGKHPQIPFLIAADENNPTIIQQYIGGPTLAHLHNKYGFSVNEVVFILKSVLSVLEYMHELNFIHRDIKPANIIWDSKSSTATLVDFGASRVLNQTYMLQKGTQTSIGSPQYVSMEQSAGKPEFVSDLYSLGITCAEILTGVTPWDLRDSNGHLMIKEFSSCPNWLDELLNSMAQPFPGQRIQSAKECLEWIENRGDKYKYENYRNFIRDNSVVKSKAINTSIPWAKLGIASLLICGGMVWTYQVIFTDNFVSPTDKPPLIKQEKTIRPTEEIYKERVPEFVEEVLQGIYDYDLTKKTIQFNGYQIQEETKKYFTAIAPSFRSQILKERERLYPGRTYVLDVQKVYDYEGSFKEGYTVKVDFDIDSLVNDKVQSIPKTWTVHAKPIQWPIDLRRPIADSFDIGAEYNLEIVSIQFSKEKEAEKSGFYLPFDGIQSYLLSTFPTLDRQIRILVVMFRLSTIFFICFKTIANYEYVVTRELSIESASLQAALPALLIIVADCVIMITIGL